jgi:hypothetical protein
MATEEAPKMFIFGYTNTKPTYVKIAIRIILDRHLIPKLYRCKPLCPLAFSWRHVASMISFLQGPQQVITSWQTRLTSTTQQTDKGRPAKQFTSLNFYITSSYFNAETLKHRLHDIVDHAAKEMPQKFFY